MKQVPILTHLATLVNKWFSVLNTNTKNNEIQV